MSVGVVADDITGANDIGSMFASSGYLVHVYAWDHFDQARHWYEQARPDVCILDTNSRLDPPEVAYQKVFTATQQLRAAGCQRFFKKTCSVFRGNIGAEFDAMLDALGEQFALVVLGFPKNGRLTINGVHYVHGQRLEDSAFQHDPIHPMTHSHLVDILQAQTQRKVALLNHQMIEQGAAVLRACVAEQRRHCNYLILDVSDQAALATIAHAVGDELMLGGSSALAEELPAVWEAVPVRPQHAAFIPAGSLGVLCAAGSLTPQTMTQIQYLQAAGTPTVELDTVSLFEPDQQAHTIQRSVATLVEYLKHGQHPLVYAANHPTSVALTQAAGARRGLDKAAVGRVVESTLAEIVARTLQDSGGQRLVVAGGETSAAICRRLGVHGLQVWQVLQPGLPSCVSLSTPPLLLVLKSGSFGSADFLEQAINHLQAQSGQHLT